MDSDSEDLAELLRIAADEGEIEFNENKTPNTNNASQKPTNGASSAEVSKPGVSQSSKSGEKSPGKNGVKLGEGAYDSSDEEDLQNFFERKYTEYGRDINTMLKSRDAASLDVSVSKEVSRSLRQTSSTSSSLASFSRPTVSQPKPSQPKSSLPPTRNNAPDEQVFVDPIFGIRIVHPLISSTMLKERMIGRNPVEIRYLYNHLQHADLSKDWCISGVILSKSTVQTSSAGSQYIIWKLSDLKGEMKQVSVFLFKNAYKDLWKTAQGTVVAVLNPSVFSRKDANDESSLSIDSAQRVMIIGKSKDLATCKSKKKNGDPCTAIVNLSVCEFCVYHVKQEYGKMSTRSDLQSATSGRGLQSLRNKVLGKSEVFYGGKSFVAEPAKPNKRVSAKDKQRLSTLSDAFKTSPMAAHISTTSKVNYLSNSKPKQLAEMVEASPTQRLKDLERLKQLGIVPGSTPQLSSPIPGNATSKTPTPPVDLNKKPSLSRESFSFSLTQKSGIATSSPGNARNNFAKARAAVILQKKPVEKSNPNFVKYRGTEAGKKRAHEAIDILSPDENDKKKQKLAEEVEKFRNERIRQLVAAKSSHTDLIEAHENNVQDQYFNKLEKKEAMEEKMLGTTEMECKAVVCLQCKYKAFSAAERCKEEKHPLKVIDSKKRFYECEECGNRTITLFRIPKVSCTNCSGSKWKRCGMIRDKSALIKAKLSIRGDEESQLGSLGTTGNLDLCVPDADA